MRRAGDAHLRGILQGMARRLGPGEADNVSKGESRLTRAERGRTGDETSGGPV